MSTKKLDGTIVPLPPPPPEFESEVLVNDMSKNGDFTYIFNAPEFAHLSHLLRDNIILEAIPELSFLQCEILKGLFYRKFNALLPEKLKVKFTPIECLALYALLGELQEDCILFHEVHEYATNFKIFYKPDY